MTTPGGVPNLPKAAMTLDSMESTLQDTSTSAMKSRAVERFPNTFDGSTGLSPASDITPFGVLTNLFSGFNSTVANADPADVQGPEDLPGLLIDFIESLPVVGQFIDLLEAINGTYHGSDQVLLTVQNIFEPIRKLLQLISGIGQGFPTLEQIISGDASGFVNDILNPTNLLARLVNGFLPAFQIPQFDASKIGSGLFNDALIPGLGTIKDAIFNAIYPAENVIGATVHQIQTALQNIPAVNVLGFAGAPSIPQTFQNILNQLWGGFSRSSSGDKSIADVANAATAISTQADAAEQIGVWNNAILGIRDNRPLDSGMDPTAVSMFPMPAATTSGGEPQYLSATATSVPMAFWIAPEDATRGSVQWLGKGNANITALYVDVYRQDKTTGALTLLHSSPDQYPQLSPSLKLCRYDMVTALRPVVVHGDILAIAWRVQGTGTHQIGSRFGLAVSDTSQVPQRPSAVRTSGTGYVGDLAGASVPYGGDVPWVALGIVSGDIPPPYYAPRTTELNAPGTNINYPPPTWANLIDVIAVGAGAGGHGGDGGTATHGASGLPGQWVTETLVRGVDFPADFAGNLVFDVGTGGYGGDQFNSPAANGGNTVRRAITGGKAALTALGGLARNYYNTSQSQGAGPGNKVYNGTTYTGGTGAVSSPGQSGQSGGAPGGGGAGGAGGFYTVAWAGGYGGRGGAWVVARQS